MTPNLTVGLMAEQIHRERLDGVAARGWLADEAAACRSHARRSPRVAVVLGAAFVRLGERMHGTPRSTGTPVSQTAAPAR